MASRGRPDLPWVGSTRLGPDLAAAQTEQEDRSERFADCPAYPSRPRPRRASFRAGPRADRDLTLDSGPLVLSAPGEPFLFKTHHPHNRIVGGGIFNWFEPMTVTAAWDLFGEMNGVPSLPRMLDRIAHYRKAPLMPGEDPRIGCVFLRDVRFFPADATAGPPPDFAPNVVQGKTYDLATGRAAGYFDEVLHRLLGVDPTLDLYLSTPPTPGTDPAPSTATPG